ncbi:MAG: hypothetical protein ACRDI2_06225 [Chloroflexota bacterium]
MASPNMPPEAARGCVYGFDPDSPLLRAALLAPPLREGTPIPSDALLDDLSFLHRLMRQQCAGYPDLLRQREFDPEAFFAQWVDTIRSAGATISCRDGILEPLVALQRVVLRRERTRLALDVGTLALQGYGDDETAAAPARGCKRRQGYSARSGVPGDGATRPGGGGCG